MPSPNVRDLAHGLLVYETAQGHASGANTPAVFRVSEKLRRPLSTLAGTTGYRVLLARAVVLAKAQVSSLNGVQVNPDGSLEGIGELRDEEAIEIVAQLLKLLVAFIGEGLTLHLVRDVWPGLPAEMEDYGESKDDATR